MIKLPDEWKLSDAEEFIRQSTPPSFEEAALFSWNACLAEVQRLNATAQPVSDGFKVPEGWKLVPIEPTEEMMRQGFEELSESKDPELGVCLSSVYRRILAAAPGSQDS